MANAQTNIFQPTATVGGFSSGSKIPIDKLKAKKALSIYIKDAPAKYEILSYSVVLDNSADKVISANCTGSAFSTQVKENLQKYLEHGHLTSFENIRVKDEKGKELKIPSIFYYID
ncbi:MAG: hypothetical protein C4330_11765 [Chitinophagaceae bacterium]